MAKRKKASSDGPALLSGRSALAVRNGYHAKLDVNECAALIPLEEANLVRPTYEDERRICEGFTGPAADEEREIRRGELQRAQLAGSILFALAVIPGRPPPPGKELTDRQVSLVCKRLDDADRWNRGDLRRSAELRHLREQRARLDGTLKNPGTTREPAQVTITYGEPEKGDRPEAVRTDADEA